MNPFAPARLLFASPLLLRAQQYVSPYGMLGDRGIAGPVMETFVGIVIGGLLTWVFCWLYYKKAGNELGEEAKRLHIVLSAVVYKLEHPEAKVEAVRDPAGRVTGLVVQVQGVASSFSAAPAVLPVNTFAPEAGDLQ